jgi:hypothetical protein
MRSMTKQILLLVDLSVYRSQSIILQSEAAHEKRNVITDNFFVTVGLFIC